MNKEQKCVVSIDKETFKAMCDTLIYDGWRVIPGTVEVSNTAVLIAGNSIICKQLLVAFFER